MRQALAYTFPVDQYGDITLRAFAQELTHLAEEPDLGDAVVRLADPSGTYADTTVGVVVNAVPDDTYQLFTLVPTTEHPSFDHQLVDQLLDRVFGALHTTQRLYRPLKAYAAALGPCGVLSLFTDLAKVYAEGAQPYLEAVRFALNGWDDPEMEIGPREAEWLHSKGMARYHNIYDRK